MSRDTIFQSLGLEGVKSRSRLGLGTSKSRKMGKSRPYFQSERKTHNNLKFLTEKNKTKKTNKSLPV